ncbi:MAG: glycerol-3-phosphate 1-O-acyltransferase PlsB [Rhodocyclaceae bacterium]|nr:glycerol-3-phosphate 1-O-acyltransferase PlsB [Rhodocyclaceae bacterium]
MASLTLVDMNLALRLLHLWVKVRVFPENAGVPETLGLDPARPVCYVLRENWWSDRLVLQDAVERAGLPRTDTPLRVSGFALTGGWRLFGRARAQYAAPPLLARLIATLAADVQLVPVTVLWGRAPKQQDSVLRALLAESWQRRNPLGHWLAVLLHGRQTHVHFGQPLSLRTLIEGVDDAALAGKKCARVLRAHFRRQREMAIGPDVSHRHTEVEALLASPEVGAAMAAAATRENLKPAVVRQLARRHALAIASDYSYGVVRAGEILLTWLWTRLFDGVEVRNLDVLTRIAAGQSLVYVPCHRSHIDYLLMSYVIFRNGLTPPYVAAGDNLDLPLIGRLLRRGGAFFLRRSFKGDPLYATVFAEYMHRMLARGFPLEFFIEGGRSRSGRMLPPKAGLLGMTVQSFVRHHERPLVFVPVYLGYEKLPEGASFVDELSGRPKRRESLWSLFSALRVLRRHFGQVYVNFGEPLPLADWLDARHPDWRTVAAESPGETGWQRGAVGEIASELVRRINAAALVNPVNLVGLALLSTPKATADADALARQIGHLQAFLDGEHSAAPADGAACIAAALKLAVVHRIEHPLGALIGANSNEAALLAYFRNNVFHLFALPALVACLVVQHGPLSEKRLLETLTDLLGLMRDSLYLRLDEADLPAALEDVLGKLAARGLIERQADNARAPTANTVAKSDLLWLGEILRPQMERYFLVLMLLRHGGSGNLTRTALLEQSVLLAQRLALLHTGKTPEFADRPLMAALIDHLLDNGILREDAEGRLAFGAALERAAAQAEALLAPDVSAMMRRLV